MTSEEKREREEILWQRQWALDKSIEWCKHINELVTTPNNGVGGKVMLPSDLLEVADEFYAWVHKDI